MIWEALPEWMLISPAYDIQKRALCDAVYRYAMNSTIMTTPRAKAYSAMQEALSARRAYENGLPSPFSARLHGSRGPCYWCGDCVEELERYEYVASLLACDARSSR